MKKRTQKILLAVGAGIFFLAFVIMFFCMNQIGRNASPVQTNQFSCQIHPEKHGDYKYLDESDCRMYKFLSNSLFICVILFMILSFFSAKLKIKEMPRKAK